MEPSLALYRRYRPETFAEVIGQDHVTEPLRQALANNRVHHAYLFSGPRGCGKTTSARILARALNCEKAPTAEPCGECRSCRDLARGGPGSLDVIEIDAASHGGVDDARDLRERAFFAPVSSRYKVYIIDEAHMVTTQGFNALLKLVEEPPEHLKFIFATTEPEKVIATIRSRTHHYPFRLIPPRVLSDHLAGICRQEGVRIDPAALPLVVRAGAGSVRDSLSVLDQLLGGAGPEGVTYEVAAGLLGYTPDNLLDEVVDAFAAADGAGVFGVVDKVIESGQDPRRFTEDVLRRLRDLVIIAAVPDAPTTGLIDAPEDQVERLVQQVARFGKADLVRAADIVATGLTEMRGATTPRLLLELICARVLLPAADDGALGLAARLDRLERRLSVAPTGGGAPEAASVANRPAPLASRSAGGQTHPRSFGTGPGPDAAVEPSAPAKASSPGPAPASGRALGLADVRRIWPDLLERVKSMRRFTWILLSQNAQVLGLDGGVLTVAFKNAGARDSFLSGGSEEILRQAAIDLIGAEWKVEVIVDPSTDPGTGGAAGRGRPAATPPVRDSAPAPDAPVEPPDWATDEAQAPRPDRADPEAVARTRRNIQPTRRGTAPEPSDPLDDPDAHVDRGDRDADDSGLDTTALLQRELGATVIEEITHE